jgi:hypothetical protein
MIPAGYLLKRVSPPPGWLGTPNIVAVCSLSDCVNDNVVDPQAAWRHNDFGLANDPETLWELAESAAQDLTGATLFYYEAYEFEIESDGWRFDPEAWRPVSPAPSASVSTDVSPPAPPLTARIIGYDVVTFGDFLEHSPMSCNSVAKDLPVNEHCLLASLDAAKDAINMGAFGGGCEEGVYKIFSVAVVTNDPLGLGSSDV